MRTTVNLEEDALLAAQSYAKRKRISIGRAISELVREATRGSIEPAQIQRPLRGRFALAPERDEVISVEFIRRLMEQENI